MQGGGRGSNNSSRQLSVEGLPVIRCIVAPSHEVLANPLLARGPQGG